MSTKYQLCTQNEGISCHAWNRDNSMIAMCPNNNEIHIYDCLSNPWKKIHSLTEHDLLVSAIDWSPVNNKIVSCSHDRNAFVWTFDESNNVWKPTLVVLRVNRAVLDVKWSLDGSRFAATSGSKEISVCFYDQPHDWYVSKLVKKKFKSTVLCCAFHPKNSQILLTGCADFKCRAYSTFSADADGTSVVFAPFSSPVAFGEIFVELSAQGWINSVAWSPSGNTFAFAGHDSSLHVANIVDGNVIEQVIRFSFLPLNRILFLNEKSIIGGGFDFNPVLFASSQGAWKFLQFIDQKPQETSSVQSSGVAAARALFQSKTSRGQESKSESDVLWTQHEAAISDMKTLKDPFMVSTSAMDGRVVVWNLPSLQVQMSSLSL